MGLFREFSVILETTFVRYVLACTSPVAVRLQYARLRHGVGFRKRGGNRYASFSFGRMRYQHYWTLPVGMRR